MSALQRQTYANTSQPLFFPINGSLPVQGDLVVEGQIESVGGPITVVDTNGVTKAALGVNGNNAYVASQSGQRIYFGGYSGLPGQTYIVPSGTTNGDAMVVGGSVSTTQLKVNTLGGAAAMGSGTLVNGAATITTTACIGVTSQIFLTRTNVNASTALGELRIRQKNVGTFLVEASTTGTPPLGAQTGDQSDFQWLVINPA